MKLFYAFVIGMSLTIAFPLYAQKDGKSSRQTSIAQQAPAVEISATDSAIRVKNAPPGSVLEIYSVVGIKVKEIKMTQPSGEYYVNLERGYYIIRIGGTVRKVAIR